MLIRQSILPARLTGIAEKVTGPGWDSQLGGHSPSRLNIDTIVAYLCHMICLLVRRPDLKERGALSYNLTTCNQEGMNAYQ